MIIQSEAGLNDTYAIQGLTEAEAVVLCVVLNDAGTHVGGVPSGYVDSILADLKGMAGRFLRDTERSRSEAIAAWESDLDA